MNTLRHTWVLLLLTSMLGWGLSCQQTTASSNRTGGGTGNGQQSGLLRCGDDYLHSYENHDHCGQCFMACELTQDCVGDGAGGFHCKESLTRFDCSYLGEPCGVNKICQENFLEELVCAYSAPTCPNDCKDQPGTVCVEGVCEPLTPVTGSGSGAGSGTGTGTGTGSGTSTGGSTGTGNPPPPPPPKDACDPTVCDFSKKYCATEKQICGFAPNAAPCCRSCVGCDDPKKSCDGKTVKQCTCQDSCESSVGACVDIRAYEYTLSGCQRRKCESEGNWGNWETVPFC